MQTQSLHFKHTHPHAHTHTLTPTDPEVGVDSPGHGGGEAGPDELALPVEVVDGHPLQQIRPTSN